MQLFKILLCLFSVVYLLWRGPLLPHERAHWPRWEMTLQLAAWSVAVLIPICLLLIFSFGWR